VFRTSVAAAALGYGVAAAAHASGFLSVYLVALWIGNTPMPLRRAILTFHEGLAFLAQIVLFIVLGLLVFPSHLASVAWSALALTAVLVFVARPLAVALCVTPLRFPLREQLFLAWAGLRGAVPIVLATFALSARVPGSTTIFNAVFFVTLVSTLAQGLTLEPFARRLGLSTEARPFYHPPVEIAAIQALGGDLLEVEVGSDDAIVGTTVSELDLPPEAIVMLIVRDESGIPPRGGTTIAAGDRLYVLVRGEVRAAAEAAVGRWSDG